MKDIKIVLFASNTKSVAFKLQGLNGKIITWILIMLLKT